LIASIILGSLPSLGRTAQDDSAGSGRQESAQGRAGVFGISGDLGYYSYGLSDVRNRLLNGGSGSVDGGLGYGAALKLNLTNALAAKVGIDYLFASTPSSRLIGGVKVETQVDLPATMIFIGGEYAFLQWPALNVKLIAGYTLVNIFNGAERSSTGSLLDLGAITGTGSGAQIGAGAEFFLSKGFSLEATLAYNLARINGATFAGSPADPSTVNMLGVVDYSGLVAKVAFTIYLI
jgi:hypothetical protein